MKEAGSFKEGFREWLEPFVKELGAEILVSDDKDSYGVAVEELGLEHQICVAHVRKYVAKRGKSIIGQATEEWGKDEERLDKLKEDLERLKGLVARLDEEGGKEVEELHKEYTWAEIPKKDEKASVAYRMRLLTLEIWTEWEKLRLYLRESALGLDRTNNGAERAIGKSKVRNKTMRGYKAGYGMKNGIALTQWLYSGAKEHDLAKVMAR